MSSSFLIPVLPTQEIKRWENYTINFKPISSIDMMEKAANSFCDWFQSYFNPNNYNLVVLCGNGNNGGDGFAIARILCTKGFEATIFYDKSSQKRSNENNINLKKLPNIDLLTIKDFNEFDSKYLNEQTIIIDAIFGIGLDRPLQDEWLVLIKKINNQLLRHLTISLDIPSGMHSDAKEIWPCIIADITFTFETPKLALLIPETGQYSYQFIIGDIGLLPSFIQQVKPDSFLLTTNYVKSVMKLKSKFAHKGISGKLFQYCGSTQTPGAAILSAKAAYSIGAGYVFCHSIDMLVYNIIAGNPELLPIKRLGKLKEANACLVGCGIGVNKRSKQVFSTMLKKINCNLIIDADGLNILADHTALWEIVPKNTIITPHPKEFDRLFGAHSSTLDRIQTQKRVSSEKQIIIVLKGAHTTITDTNGNIYFNNTGNPGLAKAGSGDVLSGIIGGLLAQRYDPINAAIIGVYVHGKAAEEISNQQHQWSMSPLDLIESVSLALNGIFPIKNFKPHEQI